MDNDTNYRKLSFRIGEKDQSHLNAETKYWKRFGSPSTTQQIGIVTQVHFSPAEPHDYVVTSSTRALVYDHHSHALKKTISRFPDTAYGAVFRSDGQVIAAGCENGHVYVFQGASRAILRQFKFHKAPTHVALFSNSKTQIFSASDDVTLRLCDLATGDQISRYTGHQDYIRTAVPLSDVTYLSGSYDHNLMLWDTRCKAAEKTLEHGTPVEKVALFPNGHIAASAGSTTVKLWDMRVGGRMLQQISSHQKTVTCAHVTNMCDRDGVSCTRLLTGSLDGHVKVYDIDTMHVAHAYRYPSGVTSMAVAPDLSCMVVGLADRSMVVRRHKLGTSAISEISTPLLHPQ